MAGASDYSTNSLWKWRERRPSRDGLAMYAVQWMTTALPRTCLTIRQKEIPVSGPGVPSECKLPGAPVLTNLGGQTWTWDSLEITKCLHDMKHAPWGKRVETIWCCSCSALRLWLTSISQPVSSFSSSCVFSKGKPKDTQKCVTSPGPCGLRGWCLGSLIPPIPLQTAPCLFCHLFFALGCSS